MKNGIENYSSYAEDLDKGNTLVIIKVPGYPQFTITLQKIKEEWNIFSENPSNITEIYLDDIKRFIEAGKKNMPSKSEDE